MDTELAIKNLRCLCYLEKDLWDRPKLVDVLVSLRLACDILMVADADALYKAPNYGTISRMIAETIDKQHFLNFHRLGLAIVDLLGAEYALQHIHITISCTKLSLYCERAVYSHKFSASRTHVGSPVLKLKKLHTQCVLGLNPFERLQKQPIVVSLQLHYPPNLVLDADHPPCMVLANQILNCIQESLPQTQFKTLEALAKHVLEKALVYTDPSVSIRAKVRKPSAINAADYPAVLLFSSTFVR